MTPRMLAQLAWVCHHDACALRHEYTPQQPTLEEYREAQRLDALADDLFDRACHGGLEHTGLDAVFGPERAAR